MEERDKGMMSLAWWAGMMHHTDPKKYPKKPNLLWEDEPEITLEQWKVIAFAIADNAHEHRD